MVSELEGAEVTKPQLTQRCIDEGQKGVTVLTQSL